MRKVQLLDLCSDTVIPVVVFKVATIRKPQTLQTQNISAPQQTYISLDWPSETVSVH